MLLSAIVFVFLNILRFEFVLTKKKHFDSNFFLFFFFFFKNTTSLAHFTTQQQQKSKNYIIFSFSIQFEFFPDHFGVLRHFETVFLSFSFFDLFFWHYIQQTERQTDRHPTDRKTNRQTDRQTDRQSLPLNAVVLRAPQSRAKSVLTLLDPLVGRLHFRQVRPEPIPDFREVCRNEERLSEGGQTQRCGCGVVRGRPEVLRSEPDEKDAIVFAHEVALDELPGEETKLVAWIVEQERVVLFEVVVMMVMMLVVIMMRVLLLVVTFGGPGS